MRNAGKRADASLEILARQDEQEHQARRTSVDALEGNVVLRDTERADDVVDSFGGTMGQGDAVLHARAHRALAFGDDFHYVVAE